MTTAALTLAAMTAAIATGSPTYDEALEAALARLPLWLPADMRDDIAARAVTLGRDVRVMLVEILRRGTSAPVDGEEMIPVMHRGAIYHLYQHPNRFDRFSGDGLSLMAVIDPDRRLRWKLRPGMSPQGLRRLMEPRAAALGVWESLDAARAALMPPGWEDMAQ